MNTKVDGATNSSGLDIVKWLFVAALVVAAVGGNIYFSGESVLYRALAITGIAIVAAFVAVTTTKGASFWQLVKDARTEIRKVVWPTRPEATQTTLIVVVFVIIMSLLLWAMDWGLNLLAEPIIG